MALAGWLLDRLDHRAVIMTMITIFFHQRSASYALGEITIRTSGSASPPVPASAVSP